MIQDDQVKGQPQTLYKDTKSNIEALSGRREGDMAYATDTDQMGIYDGSAWQWYAPVGGWINPGETWTYASATTFTVSGNQTAKYAKGTRIKLVQTTTKYFVVTGSSYSSPNTTVTITGGSDYTLANAAITGNRYSYGNPPDYPDLFNWTPELTGAGSMSVTADSILVAKFRVTGKTVYFYMRASGTTGGTASNGILFTLPINAEDGANYPPCAGFASDGGNSLCAYGFIEATTVTVRKYDASNWNLSTTRIFAVSGHYQMD